MSKSFTITLSYSVEKKVKLYSCDADIYDDTDVPLCSSVDKPGEL